MPTYSIELIEDRLSSEHGLYANKEYVELFLRILYSN